MPLLKCIVLTIREPAFCGLPSYFVQTRINNWNTSPWCVNWCCTSGNEQHRTMVHIIISVIVGAIMRKNSVLRLRTSSWAIFDMLPMCLFSKATPRFADCLFCLMTWKALSSRFIQRDSMLDLQYTYFIKAILSASKGQMEAIYPIQNAYTVFSEWKVHKSQTVEKKYCAQRKLVKLKLL